MVLSVRRVLVAAILLVALLRGVQIADARA